MYVCSWSIAHTQTCHSSLHYTLTLVPSGLQLKLLECRHPEPPFPPDLLAASRALQPDRVEEMVAGVQRLLRVLLPMLQQRPLHRPSCLFALLGWWWWWSLVVSAEPGHTRSPPRSGRASTGLCSNVSYKSQITMHIS